MHRGIKCIKKSFILQNNLRFDETMVRNDRSFYLSSVIKAHKVAFYAGCVYGHFVNRTGSLVFQSARYFEDVVTVFKNVFQLCKDCENNTFSDIMDVQFRDLFFWCKKCAGTEYESKALNDVKNFLDVFCMKNMIIERCKPTTVKMIREFESQNSNVKI